MDRVEIEPRRAGAGLAIGGLLTLCAAVTALGCGSGNADLETTGTDASVSADADASEWPALDASGSSLLDGATEAGLPDAADVAPDVGPPEATTLDASLGLDAGSLAPDGGGPDAAAPDAGPWPTLADCAAAPLRTSFTVYYFCDCQEGASASCVPGNDSNSGTDPAAPRRSVAAAFDQFRRLSAGETVALCRGGAWGSSAGPVSDNGYLNNASCTPASPCELRDYVPPQGASSWPRPRLNVSSATNIVHVTSGGGYRFWNIDFQGDDPFGANIGIFRMYGTAHDIDVCNVRVADAGKCLLVQADRSPMTGVTVRGSQFYRCWNDGAISGYATGLIIDGNYFEDMGSLRPSGGLENHAIYLGPGPDMRIRNNHFHNPTLGTCRGTIVVVHPIGANFATTGISTDSLWIDNNLLEVSDTCWGFQLSGGWGDGEMIQNSRMTRNRMIYKGAAATNGALVMSLCHGCTMSDNVVVNGRISLGGGCGGDLCVKDITVQNNTVYGAGSLDTGISTGTGQAPGDPGYVIENNAMYTAQRADCFSFGGTIQRMGNNYCRSTSENAGVALSGMFADAPNGDLRPASGGPLVGTGSATSYSPLAIGAVQWSPSDPGVPRSPPTDIGAMIH